MVFECVCVWWENAFKKKRKQKSVSCVRLFTLKNILRTHIRIFFFKKYEYNYKYVGGISVS